MSETSRWMEEHSDFFHSLDGHSMAGELAKLPEMPEVPEEAVDRTVGGRSSGRRGVSAAGTCCRSLRADRSMKSMCRFRWHALKDVPTPTSLVSTNCRPAALSGPRVQTLPSYRAIGLGTGLQQEIAMSETTKDKSDRPAGLGPGHARPFPLGLGEPVRAARQRLDLVDAGEAARGVSSRCAASSPR